MHGCIHTCMLCMHACICTCMCVCAFTCLCMCVCMCMDMSMCMCWVCYCICICMSMGMCVRLLPYLLWLKLSGCHEQPCPANPFLYGELLQSILCVLQPLETQGDRAAMLHHLLVQESDGQTKNPTQRQILHPSKEELLQSILLLHIASWIQTFDCKKLRRLPMFASKNITTEHRM